MIADIKDLVAGTAIKRGYLDETWHGIVVFNNTIKSYSEEYPEDLWAYLGNGFMTEYKEMGLVFTQEVDDEEIIVDSEQENN